MRTNYQNKELESILTFLGIQFIDYNLKRCSNGHVTARTVGEVRQFFGKEVMTTGQYVEDIHWWAFQSDWDDLMFLLKRIKNVVDTELTPEDVLLHNGLEQRLNPFLYEKWELYNGAVEFIKWYNDKYKK